MGLMLETVGLMFATSAPCFASKICSEHWTHLGVLEMMVPVSRHRERSVNRGATQIPKIRQRRKRFILYHDGRGDSDSFDFECSTEWQIMDGCARGGESPVRSKPPLRWKVNNSSIAFVPLQ
ncbi:hypothetical protein B0H10DRAFT_574070 [Mycena sp. CBHHK59/15]|nr:hypothetical protein B0H10DRAFT_574070 [Mycena sp. CBHHK59/15]